LTWIKQRRFLPLLPEHLARIALFDLNTGVRDSVVCKSRWDWDVWIEDLQRPVFIVPRQYVKGPNGSGSDAFKNSETAEELTADDARHRRTAASSDSSRRCNRGAARSERGARVKRGQSDLDSAL